jgi:arylsulfatase A-like enzyme
VAATPRRAFASGVALGIAGAALVALVELVYLIDTAYGWFDGPGELLRFAVYGLSALAGAGLVAGLAEGTLAALAVRLWPGRVPSLAVTGLAAPPVALASALAFRGPHARTIPGHTLWAVLLGVGLLGLVQLAVVAYRRILASVDERRRVGWATAGLALVLLVGAYVADQRVLPRLYPFFHVALLAVAFVSAQVAAATVAALRRVAPSERTVGAIAAVVALAGALSLHQLDGSRGLRTLALERTAPLARLLKLAHRTRAPSATAPVVAAPVEPRPVQHGPHLGAVDVFLITVDAMRADRLTPDVAPTMRALADRGVDFTHAYAQVPHTSFSIATLLTGKHVFALSALGLDAASHETLAQVMRRERYKTAAFYPPSVFFIDHDRLKGLETSNYGFEYVKYEYLPADRRTDQVIQFFTDEQPAHAFVWVHYLEPHEPYEVHPGVTRGDSTQARYDGEIRYVDGQVARLLDWIRAHRERALVILAADHGEELGEHGGHYHGTTLYDEQVRVPLAFALINGEGVDPTRIEAPVGLIDVAPTILGLAGIETSLRMRGQDLSPLFSRETATGFAAPGSQFAEIDRKKAIVDGSDKLICDLEADSCQGFDLARDPKELHPIVEGPMVTRLRARLDAWMAAETRFEAERVAAEGPTRRTLERARLGDRGATKELAALLRDADPSVRREAARLLVALPPDPSVRASLESIRDDASLRRWAELGLSRLGDQQARAVVAGFIGEACAGDDGALCARAALALGDATWEGRALERGGLDEPLTVALARALGASHDPALLPTLVTALGPVRTRAGVVDAIAELGARDAIPTLERWLPAEPYIPVRAQMARALGKLAARDPGERARVRPSLERLAAVEREPLVMRALVDALAQLGAPSVRPVERAQAAGPGELWIVGDGPGALTVGDSEVPFAGGVARVDATRAGALSVKGRDGAKPRLAFWRPVPLPT